MLNKKHTALLFITCLLQCLFFAGWFFLEANRLTDPTAKTILVKVIPVDPRDYLSGNYLTLRYDFSNVRRFRKNKSKIRYKLGEEIFAVLKQQDKWFIADYLSTQKPVVRDNQAVLKGRISSSNGNIQYGIEKYFINEGQKEPNARKDKIEILLIINTDLKPKIKSLLVNNVNFTNSITASFSCELAESPMEQTICSVPRIAELDKELAKGYTQALSKLSPAGQKILRKSQRDWIKYVNDACFKFSAETYQEECLSDEMHSRVRDMKTAAIQVGPFLFSRIDYFNSKPETPLGRPYLGQISYLRIDQPLPPEAIAWNKLMHGKAEVTFDGCDGPYGDSSTSSRVTFATNNIISIEKSDWQYCHGTNHGFGGSNSRIVILKPYIHTLTKKDILRPNTEWKDFITDICMKAQQLDGSKRENMISVVTNIKNWSLNKEGLAITFSPYSLGTYLNKKTEVLIPWEELSPFITPEFTSMLE
jgi:uncharacterized membrane-anchored protein